jgi:hypothetical protein
MPSDAFLKWVERSVEDLATVQDIMSQELSDAPAELQHQLTIIEAWHGRMTHMLAWANSFLDQAEQAALMVRHDDWTDLDRKTNLRAGVVEERRIRDILDGICEGIKNRLMLGMALMKAQTGEKAGGRVHS